MKLGPTLDRLVESLRRLPGIGPRSAQRIAFHLVQHDRDMLEDLVAAAFNDAVRRAEELTQQKMSAVTAGMPLPPGFKMPF